MNSWRLLALAVLGALAAVFCFAAFDWTSGVCRLPAGDPGKVLAPDFGGCIEFWLNRYQTFSSAMIALAAAAVAWLLTARQIKVAEKSVSDMRLQFEYTRKSRLLSAAEELEDPSDIENEIRSFFLDYLKFRVNVDSELNIGRIELMINVDQRLPEGLYELVPSCQDINSVIERTRAYKHRADALIKKLRKFHYRATVSGLIIHTEHEIKEVVRTLNGVDRTVSCLEELSKLTEQGYGLGFPSRMVRKNYLRCIDTLKANIIELNFAREYHERVRNARGRMELIDFIG